MSTLSIQDTLVKAGLAPSTAEIYLILLEKGESTVPEILPKTTLSRAMVYEALALLLAERYVEYRKDGKWALYKPVHPGKLMDLLAEKKREMAALEQDVTQAVGALAGAYGLLKREDGTQFLKGSDCARAFQFLLDTGKPIESMVAVQPSAGAARYAGEEWTAERVKKNIPLRVIYQETPVGAPVPETPLLEARMLSRKLFPCIVDTYISGTVTLLASDQKDAADATAVIIDERSIAEHFHALFASFWELGAEPSSSLTRLA